MPQIIKTLDEIGVKKGRDVLFLKFRFPRNKNLFGDYVLKEGDVDLHKNRNEIIFWLEQNSIAFEDCFVVGAGTIISVFQGSLYIDVPFEKENSMYMKLSTYLQDDELGETRFGDVVFCCLPFTTAKQVYEQRLRRAENTDL